MELIRYKPGEAIRWLETGAESIRKSAKKRGKSVLDSDGPETGTDRLTKNLKNVAGALMDVGKSTWADLLHHQAEASEFVLQDDHFDVVKPGTIKSIPYSRVESAKQKGEQVTLTLDKGSVVIKPYAHLLVGRIKVPLGWSRNGIEVPYELLVEELCARCGVNLQHL